MSKLLPHTHRCDLHLNTLLNTLRWRKNRLGISILTEISWCNWNYNYRCSDQVLKSLKSTQINCCSVGIKNCKIINDPIRGRSIEKNELTAADKKYWISMPGIKKSVAGPSSHNCIWNSICRCPFRSPVLNNVGR